MNSRDRARLLWSLFTLLVLVVTVPVAYRWWVRPPVVQLENLDCVQLLRTACSAQNRACLDGVKRLVTNRTDSGKMDDKEAAAIQRILAIAESDNWQLADREAQRLEQAQLSRRR